MKSIPVSIPGKIPDSVLGISFLIAAEIMFFSGLISAYIINRSGVENWPPIGQIRLPVIVTGINTLILASSGITLYLSEKINVETMRDHQKSSNLLLLSLFLGIFFLVVQGSEWINMLNYGLHTTGNIFGAFFYTMIGAHGLHVLAGIFLLVYIYFLKKNSGNDPETRDRFKAFSLYWYFVVAIWPVLYVLLYVI